MLSELIPTGRCTAELLVYLPRRYHRGLTSEESGSPGVQAVEEKFREYFINLLHTIHFRVGVTLPRRLWEYPGALHAKSLNKSSHLSADALHPPQRTNERTAQRQISFSVQ